MKDKKVCLTEKEVLENPNDNKLGELVRKKFWNLKKDNKQKSWMTKLILDDLIKEGVIEESRLAPGYYGNKNDES
jgi:hypothetical protein